MTEKIDFTKLEEIRQADEQLSYMLDVEEINMNIQNKPHQRKNERRKNH